MNCDICIRPARESDARELLAIYAPYVSDTCVSFETEVPSIREFCERIRRIGAEYPYLVCESGGVIAGYAYASAYAERRAYRFSADLSVYVAPEFQRRGIGRLLYYKMFAALARQGIYTVYACVTYPNEKSVAFHSSMGFHEVGHFHNAGFKHGAWRDIVWLERPLREYDSPSE